MCVILNGLMCRFLTLLANQRKKLLNAATVKDERCQYGVKKMDDIVTTTTTTNSDISRLNARYLAESAGGFKQFGDKVGLTNARVSQLIGKNPSRNIGTRVARRIEVAFDKPRGWIDQHHDKNGLTALSAAAMNDRLSTELRILKEQVAKASVCLRSVETANEIDKRNLVSMALSILEKD
jgi:hypothetical protein